MFVHTLHVVAYITCTCTYMYIHVRVLACCGFDFMYVHVHASFFCTSFLLETILGMCCHADVRTLYLPSSVPLSSPPPLSPSPPLSIPPSHPPPSLPPSLPAALSQAGQQMEDSVVAAYCALVLGLLTKHNLVSSRVVRVSKCSSTRDMNAQPERTSAVFRSRHKDRQSGTVSVGTYMYVHVHRCHRHGRALAVPTDCASH